MQEKTNSKMLTKVEHVPSDFYRGKCRECGGWSVFIVKDDGRCADCIDREKEAYYLLKIKQNEIRD